MHSWPMDRRQIPGGRSQRVFLLMLRRIQGFDAVQTCLAGSDLFLWLTQCVAMLLLLLAGVTASAHRLRNLSLWHAAPQKPLQTHKRNRLVGPGCPSFAFEVPQSISSAHSKAVQQTCLLLPSHGAYATRTSHTSIPAGCTESQLTNFQIELASIDVPAKKCTTFSRFL